MHKKVLVALDQGTTSSRAVVFDLEGHILSQYAEEFPQIYPQPGWVEHDPMEIWSTQMGVAMEAMQKIHEHQSMLSLVLLDLKMPVMDGITATRAIRALERPDAATIPIIAMTANVFDDDVESTRKAGMNAHLGKPVEPERLYDMLARIMPPRV